jgi:hypothetical protein
MPGRRAYLHHHRELVDEHHGFAEAMWDSSYVGWGASHRLNSVTFQMPKGVRQ